MPVNLEADVPSASTEARRADPCNPGSLASDSAGAFGTHALPCIHAVHGQPAPYAAASLCEGRLQPCTAP